MKKIVFLIISVLIAISVLCVSLFVLDNDAPTITLKSNPVLACNITRDDLLNNAVASDDDLKSFFIEENDLLQIAETGKVTYIAIDGSNNVRRVQFDVDVDSDVKTYHIEAIAPLEHQVNNILVSSNYFTLVNECGWNISDSFNVDGINTKQIGDYEVIVSSRKHQSPDFDAVFIVDDFKAPKIYLNTDLLENYTGRYWNDEYFMEFIDHIEDDNDDPNKLMNRVKVNWQSVMNPTSSGRIDNPGTYTVTYSVTDSEGNTGKTTLRVKLERYIGEE